MWAKSGGSEAANKVSFAMKVAGTDYEVAAGVYADKKSGKLQTGRIVLNR